MPQSHKVAVVLMDTTSAQTPLPSLPAAINFFRDGPHSVTKYWQDNSNGWLEFPVVDFFGWSKVDLPTKENTSRWKVIEKARALYDLAGYDNIVVVVYPGVDQNGVEYDYGGDGNACSISNKSHSITCHEFGHTLGLDENWGLPTPPLFSTGLYGDPYEIMSAEVWGGAAPWPIFALPPSESLDGKTATWAGPMHSRALLHFTRPMALDDSGLVLHVHEGDADQYLSICSAGSGQAPELIAFHPAAEEASGRGRVYVEYRQNLPQYPWSRWDAGLSGGGDVLARCGVVVHVVDYMANMQVLTVWYRGRIPLPTADVDLQVDTPFGPISISIPDQVATQVQPKFVQVSFGSLPRSVRVAVELDESRDIVATEKRQVPGFEWAGTFTWERWRNVVHGKYTPFVKGVGKATPSNVDWFLAGAKFPSASGAVNAVADGAGTPSSFTFDINAETNALTLQNVPQEAPIRIEARVRGSSAQPGDSAEKALSFEVRGVEEGWGQDYWDFMDVLEAVAHPIPKPKLGVPPIEVWNVINRVRVRYQRLALANPTAARLIKSRVADYQRAARRVLGY